MASEFCPGLNAVVKVFMNESDAAIILTDKELNIVDANVSASGLFDFDGGPPSGRNLRGLLDPESLRGLDRMLKLLRIDGESVSLSLSLFDFLGLKRSFRATVRFLLCAQTQEPFFAFFLRKPRDEQRPPFSEVEVAHTIKLLVKGLSDSVLLIDFKKRAICACNPPAVAMFGYAEEEMIGRSPHFLAADPRKSLEHAKRSVASYMRSGFYQDAIEGRKKDGASFLTLATNIALFNSKRELAFIIAINRDITREQDQLASVKALAGQAMDLLRRIDALVQPMAGDTLSRCLSEMGFSGRQVSLVSRLVSGEATKAIAAGLSLSESTVKNELSGIYRRIGVASRVELAQYLHERHIRIE